MNRSVSLAKHSLVPLGPAHACPADTYAHCFWHSKGCIPAGGHLCSEPTGRRVSGGGWHESATRFPGPLIGTSSVWERHGLLCSGNGDGGGPYRRSCVFLDGTFPAHLALLESSWNVCRIQRRIQRLGPVVAIQIGALSRLFVCFVYFAFSALFSSIVNSSNCPNISPPEHSIIITPCHIVTTAGT
ncbi:hypothetical protein BO78DRAFT_1158 [Aspergillus sclerotiicarbonarius CBS 121057]|uniref:Uncharacterized protein n=1 Tax=Aspergillus sclerotiicarbonarius (strain CBS 121057 / IBT 28362) TaxID=1448318 RepID=A0A319EPK2_ASPSB|nr:hypothetical protein BO78DRAFT_1158 [Aspergillus sclerotiicarbonarius CBS 121057]